MIRLLIVDDAPFVREVVRHTVQGEIFQVVGEAEDGIQAVEMARELKPDIVLMDLVLPRLNGIDATRRILHDRPETQVVAFSTNDHESMVMKALDAGCCSFVGKPFTGEQLVEALRQAFENSSEQDSTKPTLRFG